MRICGSKWLQSFRRSFFIAGIGIALASSLIAQSPGTGEAYTTYHLPPDKLAKAIVLGRERLFLHFGFELWGLAVLWLLLASGTAAKLADWVARRSRLWWLQGGIYSALLVIAVFIVGEIPFAVAGHAVSLHYGISVEGWGAWLLDMAKALGLAVVLETPLLMLALGLMRWDWSQRRYWLWFWAAAVPIMLLGTFLLPALVEPLFDTYEPLAQSHPALVRDLERVVARTGTSIPPERMFLMKASEKSNGLNAYVTGIGASKRIVIWDTTADRMPEDEILFTFAHESGHYVLNHIPKGLALATVGMFMFFWLTASLSAWLVRRFGVRWHVDSIGSLPGLTVLLLVVMALQVATEPITSFASRHIEHEADVYGQEAIHGIVADPQRTAVAAFQQLGEVYLDDPDPNKFVEFWISDHPSIQSRSTFAAHYDPWAAGQTPTFFSKP
ncbi:M48 family metallopeptidase [Acidicapsa ligni]|uniref:M48 family metallopeptidase n=1 Tax=Acidicapsa ligni TaxID=542300 RepID=UPI0021E09B0B|nr:M48 family metallopeptidase [Acidicapsa ligni]